MFMAVAPAKATPNVAFREPLIYPGTPRWCLLAYNLQRVIKIIGAQELIAEMRA